MTVTHKMTMTRILSILLAPIFLSGFTIITTLFGQSASINILILLLFNLLVFTPYLLIIVNHYKYAKGVVVHYDKNRVTLNYSGTIREFDYNEILKITEYHGYNMGNVTRGFCYWCIETQKENFIISFLTVPPLNFERMFWNKIEENEVRWPSIKSDKC